MEDNEGVRDMPNVCNCRKAIEDKLTDTYGQNVFLSGYDMISGKSATPFEHKDGRRKKTSYMFHAYCPFCGKKYEIG
jgi:hypothetical protein